MTMPGQEPELLSKLKKGDVQVFETLYSVNKHRLAVMFIKLLRDDDLVKDALQNLFVRVWNNRATINTNKSFSAYLYKIAQNLVID